MTTGWQLIQDPKTGQPSAVPYTKPSALKTDIDTYKAHVSQQDQNFKNGGIPDWMSQPRDLAALIGHQIQEAPRNFGSAITNLAVSPQIQNLKDHFLGLLTQHHEQNGNFLQNLIKKEANGQTPAYNAMDNFMKSVKPAWDSAIKRNDLAGNIREYHHIPPRTPMAMPMIMGDIKEVGPAAAGTLGAIQEAHQPKLLNDLDYAARSQDKADILKARQNILEHASDPTYGKYYQSMRKAAETLAKQILKSVMHMDYHF